MNSQKIRSQKHVAQKQQRRRRQLVALVVAAFLILGGLIGLTHWSAVQIDSFEISTEADLPEEQIREVVSRQLDRRLWYVIARDNVLLLPVGQITTRITNLTPRIKQAKVDRTGLREFALTIQTRNPAAQVCSTDSATTSGCLLVDSDGFVYKNASGNQSTSTELFVYQTDNLPEVGSQLKTAQTFQILQSFLDKLSELSFQPLSATLKDHEDVFIQTRQTSATTTSASTTVELRINLADDLSQKFTDLKSVVQKDSFVASTTEETVNGRQPSISPFALEYIDLRFGNKVFYK